MSVLLGEHVLKMLTDNTEVRRFVGDRVYPMAMPESTAYPFVKFDCMITNPTYSKDGLVEDACSVTVNCVSKSYAESLMIAQAVRNALEMHGGRYDTFAVTESKLSSMDSNFDMDLDAFAPTLNFEIITEPRILTTNKDTEK